MSLSVLHRRGRALVRPECVLATSDGTLHVAHFGGGVTQILTDGGQRDVIAIEPPVPICTNGFAIDANGDYLIANLGDAGGFWRLTQAGAVTPLLTAINGAAVPPANYIHLGADGVLWGTVSTRHLPRSLAWRDDVADGFIVALVDGKAHIAAEGLGYANECQVSPDGRWLYVNETFAQRLSRFPITGRGRLGERDVVARFTGAALPDGLAFDADGGVWVVCIITNEVVRIAPDGSRTVLLSDHDPMVADAFAAALAQRVVPADALSRRQAGRLGNIASMAFCGADLFDVALGVLLDDSLPMSRSAIAGAPPVHWHWGERCHPRCPPLRFHTFEIILRAHSGMIGTLATRADTDTEKDAASMQNLPPLSLHVPAPPARPGDVATTFDAVVIPPAGQVRCPDNAAPEAELRDLPYALIRVLDDDGRAVGPWNPGLSPDVMRAGLRAMLLTRVFDDRMFRAHRQGKTSFYMKSTGEEAIGAAQSMALSRRDMCFPTYRVMSWLHARGYPLSDIANQIFSNAKDPLKGRQLPILFSARDYGFYTISGNLGSRFGHAVGWAMASAYKQDDRIALGYIGEGSTAEGDFHTALTFASVYRAPCILAITNNQWAISSFSGIAGANETTFAAKAIGYGLPGLRVDGNDFLAIWVATTWAAERARTNNGTTLIEFFTYRVSGHSTSDDPTRYRPQDEVAQWPLGDPVERLKQHLIVLSEWDEDRHAVLIAELEAEVKAAVRSAEAIGTLGMSKPDVGEMFEDVFKEPDWRIIEQRRELGV